MLWCVCVCVCVSQINCVRQLHHLPELVVLQSDLLRVFPLTSAAQTIEQMFQQMPAGKSTSHLLLNVYHYMLMCLFLFSYELTTGLYHLLTRV